MRGHLGVQEVPGEPQTSFAFGEINPDAVNTGKGRSAAWESANPCLKEAFCDIFITPGTRQRGCWGSEDFPAGALESSGLSCCSDHAGDCSVTRGWKWNLLSGSLSAGKTGLRNPTLCLAVSGAFGVSAGSIPALPDTPVCSPSAPSICQQPGRN